MGRKSFYKTLLEKYERISTLVMSFKSNRVFFLGKFQLCFGFSWLSFYFMVISFVDISVYVTNAKPEPCD